MSVPLANDALQKLRTSLDTHLSDSGTYEAIRQILSSSARQSGSGAEYPSQDVILGALSERGILSQLLSSLHEDVSKMQIVASGSAVRGPANDGPVPVVALRPHPVLRPDWSYLLIHVLSITNAGAWPPGAPVQIHISFAGERNSTTVSTTLQFDDQMLFPLGPNAPSSTDLVAMKLPLCVAVTSSGTLLGAARLDWRRVLRTGSVSLAIEVSPPDPDLDPVGVLSLKLEVVPRLTTSRLRPELDEAALALPQQQAGPDFTAARKWWSEFEFKSRSNLKIFAISEFGSQLVTSYVTPLQCREIATPLEAARFVSLLPTVPELASPSRGAIWLTYPSFLACGRCSATSHALLLCSLLLGFGLNAFVVLGVLSAELGGMNASWVMTRSPVAAAAAAAGGPKSARICFWDPVTGTRTLLSENTRYGAVDMLFNHASIYAVNQMDTSIKSIDLQEQPYALPRWSVFKPAGGSSSSKAVCSLHASRLNVAEAQLQVENDLRALILDMRKLHSLATEFDPQLEHILGQALVTYELERTEGAVPANAAEDFFGDAIRHAVPKGATFKALPLHFAHLSAEQMMQTILRNSPSASGGSVGKGIVLSNGKGVKLAVRCSIRSWPENVVSVWLLVGCISSL